MTATRYIHSISRTIRRCTAHSYRGLPADYAVHVRHSAVCLGVIMQNLAGWTFYPLNKGASTTSVTLKGLRIAIDLSYFDTQTDKGDSE